MISKNSLRLFVTLTFLSFSMFAQQPGVPMKPGEVNRPSVPSVNTTITSSSSNSDVYGTLSYVNSLFNRFNEYNTKLAIDERRGELVFSDKFLELRGSYDSVEFRRSNELMGLYCKSSSECINVTDVDTRETEPNKVKYTFGLKGSDDKAIPEMDRVISSLNSMLSNLATNNVSASGNSAVRANLRIINDAFDTYNNYETVFSVKGETLYWDSTVANVYADLNDLTFYIDYKNNWMVMRCTNDDCIKGSVSQDSYSMGLSDDNGIAPNIEKVLQAFNDLRREVLTN